MFLSEHRHLERTLAIVRKHSICGFPIFYGLHNITNLPKAAIDASGQKRVSMNSSIAQSWAGTLKNGS